MKVQSLYLWSEHSTWTGLSNVLGFRHPRRGMESGLLRCECLLVTFLTVATKGARKPHKEGEFVLAHGSSGDAVYHGTATEPAPANATRREKLLAPTLVDKEAEKALAQRTVAHDSPLGLHLPSCLQGQRFPQPATTVPKLGTKCSPMSLSTFKC